MTTSKGITVASEYEDIIFYKAICACQEDSCIHTLIMEYDKDINSISLSLYAKVCYDYWHEIWPFKILRRLETAWTLIRTGYIEHEGRFDFGGEDQIRDYIKALQEGLIKLRKNKIENKKEVIKPSSKVNTASSTKLSSITDFNRNTKLSGKGPVPLG